MKTIGILGGMSWESTAVYYRLINQGIKARLGGLHSARILVNSLDFEDIAALQRSGDWDTAGAHLARAAAALEGAGADAILIATNTMHVVAPQVEAAIGVPLLHIADAAGARLKAEGIARVGLLGTAFTMQQPFYREHLENHFGLEVLLPGEADMALVHEVIFDELCVGVIRQSSNAAYRAIIDRLARAGAEAVLLGCTEIGLLIGPKDASIPLIDTTVAHAEAAVAYAMAD